MPPLIHPNDERLIAAYQEAALRLSRLLQAAAGKKRNRQALAAVSAILSQLDAISAQYIQVQVPFQFNQGSAEAVSDLKDAGMTDVNTENGDLHQQSAQLIADDAAQKFTNALEGVRRSSQNLLSSAAKQQALAEMIAEQTQGDASTTVQQVLAEQGVVAIRTPNRNWTLEDYASMLTRTVLADAHNTGAMTRYASNGVKYAQIIERGTAPDVTCQFMRGKFVVLGDRRLIPPYHPNCMGGIVPVLETPENPITSVDDPQIPDEVQAVLLGRG